MIKNKKTHIIYRSIYLVIGLIGIISSFGAFNGVYNPNWYLYYTNISNYFCFFTVLALLIHDVKAYRNGEKVGVSSIAPLFRFCVCVMIFITFIVFNTLLTHPFSVEYWIDLQSVIMHLILPIMFILDYMLFSKHRSVNVFAPLFACIVPLIYVLYILIRAEVYLGTGRMIYPYFFLNVQYFGYGGVALWCLGIAAIVILVGYLFWMYDKLIKNDDGKLKLDFSPLPKPIKEECISKNNEIQSTNEQTEESIDVVSEGNKYTTEEITDND